MTHLPKFWFQHTVKTGVTTFFFSQPCKLTNNKEIQFFAMNPMKIPPEIWTKVIPSQNLSVSDIQKFPLPELAISKSPSPQIHKFLSHLTPNITNIEEIILLPTPSEDLLKTLLKCSQIRQSQSFICEHLDSHTGLRIPLWTVGYWLEVLKIGSIKHVWASAQRNLDFLQKERLLTDNLIKQVWKDKIIGLHANLPPEHLTSYLTRDWLTD